MKLVNVSITNFKSIINSGLIEFSETLFVLAGQNESGKSSILEALEAYEKGKFEKDSLNFEEEQSGNLKQSVSCTYRTNKYFYEKFIYQIRKEFELEDEIDILDKEKISKIEEYTINKTFNHENGSLETKISETVYQIVLSSINTEQKIEINENGDELNHYGLKIRRFLTN